VLKTKVMKVVFALGHDTSLTNLLIAKRNNDIPL